MINDIFEPGAAKYGNFIDYYKFNPSDKRIEILPPEFWKQLKIEGPEALCLDVGCNSGELTAALYERMSSETEVSELKFVGVDIDGILIERAREQFQNENISFICGDITTDSFKIMLSDILKTNACKSFNVIFMFSVTMWLHLNYGDVSFKKLLTYLAQSTDFLVLEPQPWKCYKNALRRMRKYKKDHFPEFNKLEMRESVENDIDKYLTENCGMTIVYQSDPSHWGRRIKLFKQFMDPCS